MLRVLSIMFLFPTLVFAATDVEFILDVSGSMKHETQGESQISTARKALGEALHEIPSDAEVALRVYGHRVEQSNKTESCKDSELLVPFSASSPSQIPEAAGRLQPKGYTPIAYSLEQSRADFSAEREAEKVIILLSDGEETCGGDPVAVLKRLKDEGFKVKVYSVGFNVDNKARAQLEEIARAGDGEYFDAKNSEELGAALKQAAKAAVVIDKDKALYGREIRGGNSYESAVELPVGEELRLDHHQKKNDFDYFYLDLKKGQEMGVELHTFEKGISLRNGEAKENDNPYMGAQISSSDRNTMKTINLIGEKHKAQTASAGIPQNGRYYLLVGSTYDDMNKDNTSFKVSVISRGDLGTDTDAGDSDAEALTVEPKRYPVNYLGGVDSLDLFAFNGKLGESYFVGIIPNDNKFDNFFKIRVLDEYKQILLNEGSKIGAGIKTDAFKLDSDGKYYIEISLGSGSGAPIPYTLDLKRTAENEGGNG